MDEYIDWLQWTYRNGSFQLNHTYRNISTENKILIHLHRFHLIRINLVCFHVRRTNIYLFRCILKQICTLFGVYWNKTVWFYDFNEVNKRIPLSVYIYSAVGVF